MTATAVHTHDHGPRHGRGGACAPRPRRHDARAPEHVYRRRRLIVIGTAVVAVMAAMVLGGRIGEAGAGAEQVGSPGEVGSTMGTAGSVHVVQPGDTLWSIATELAPDSDPRPVVAQLREAAGGAELQPGQRIVVPVEPG